MPPPLVEPSRAAHASLGGYLYQVYLGVERWLDLGPDEVLRCEGDEDLDRLLLDGSGGVSEQVKALTGKINLRDEVMKGTLRRFVVSHHVLRTGTPPDERRFVFTSTAERRRQKRDPTLPIDALESWEAAQSDEAVRGQVVAALHALLPFPEPDKGKHPGQHRFWRSLKAALKWLDASPARWADLVGSIRWQLEAPDRPDVRATVQEALRRRGAPDGFFDRLVGEILEASCDPDPAKRLRTRADLEDLLSRAHGEWARWSGTARGRHLVRVLGDLDRLARVLYDKASELPPNPSPGRLLSAAYEVIPFEEEGRKELLDDLAAWCAASASKGLRLLHGEGGAGKTRLLLEFCRRLGAQGWWAGFLQPTTREAELVELLEGEVPRFAVLDYAESHLESVRFLVSRLANRRSGPKIRVVLLARRSGDWWEALERQGDANHDFLALTPPRPVKALVPGLEERKAAFLLAAWAFAERLGSPLPARVTAPDLSHEDFGRALVLHMAAFLAALGQPVGTLPDVLAEVLVHEWRYWDRMARGLGNDEETRDELREALRRAAVILTLLGGAPAEAAAKEIARRALPPGATESRVGAHFHLLERLYGTDPSDERFLQGLEPDLLGEELVRQGLTRQPALLSLTLELGTEPGRRQLLTVLARLARKPESAEAATAWLQQAYSEALEPLAEIALDVAVAQGDPVGRLLAPVLQRQASAELAQRLMERCNHSELRGSTPLREVALVVTKRSVEEHRKKIQTDPGPDAQAELAKCLIWLGIRCTDLGQREAALETDQEAVDIRRRLAEQRPDVFLPDLARSLNSLGVDLSDLGQLEDALEASQEAVDLIRRLAEQRPDAFLPDLARSLNNLGNMRSDLGQREDALEASQEAVDLIRRLAEQRPDAFLSYLALSLNNLGNMRSDLGQREDALEASQEAVDLIRRLAEQRPDAFLPDLARSLNGLGVDLSDLGQREAALEATQEAVDLYRRLAEQRPDAFLPDLATSLNNLGSDLSALGQREDALEATQEALLLLRPYFLRHPAAFGDQMKWTKTSYEKAAAALGRKPDRKLLDEIEAVLKP